MLDVSVILGILFGLMLLVIGLAVVCWRARVRRLDGRRHRRFHRKDIMVATGVCLCALAVIGLTVLKMF